MAIPQQLEQRLESAIQAVAPSAKILLMDVNGRISGTVVAPEFEGTTHLARQRKVWDKIRSQLGPDSLEVGMLLLYSPEEADALDETKID
jgi:acid stress-induced BolA-like protein IbaG/YrbA